MSDTKTSEAAAPKEVWVEVCIGTPMDVHKMPKSNDGFPSGWAVVRYIRDDLHDETHPQPAELAEQQGAELPPLPDKVVVDKHLPTGICLYGYTPKQMQDYARAALAATGKQQVGEVHGWSGWATQKPGHMPKLWGTREIADLNHDPDGDARLIFLSAQGIDLGQFRELAESWKIVSDPDPTPIMQAHQHANHCCADELLAMIDGQSDAAMGDA